MSDTRFSAYPTTSVHPRNKGLTKLEWMVGRVLPSTVKIYSGYDSAVEAAIEISICALKAIEEYERQRLKEDRP